MKDRLLSRTCTAGPICRTVMVAIGLALLPWLLASQAHAGEGIEAQKAAVLTPAGLSGGLSFPICTASDRQTYPDIAGSIVVWQDTRDAGVSGADVYGKDLSTGQEFALCTAPGDQGGPGPSVAGNVVVWEDWRDGNGDIYGHDLSSGQEFPICDLLSQQRAPDISGGIVVWEDSRDAESSGRDIYGRDLSTGEEFAICTAPGDQGNPGISGDMVVWEDARNSDATGWDIYGKDLSTGEEFAICTAPGHQAGRDLGPAISGSIVVWEDSRSGSMEIYAYDISTGEELPICTGPGPHYSPDISGSTVVWDDYRDGDADIYGYDLSSDQEFPVCIYPGTQNAPAVSGGVAVWHDDRYGIWDIYGAEFLETRFLDVPAYFWAFDEVEACCDCGIVGGYDDGLYHPSNPVSRDQMAVFVSRSICTPTGEMSLDDYVPPTTPSFSDVPTDFWCYKYIEYAVEHTIVGGYEDGTYQPQLPLDRGQMAVFIARAMAGDDQSVPDPMGDPSFPDVPADFWSYRHIEHIAGEGVAGGYFDGLYHPENPVDRAQMAVFICRAFDLPI